jgi:phosphoglycerate dehydrogenase-like enzyme
MTRFKKIVAVDETLLNEEALQQLQKLGEEVVVYHDFPQDEHIVTERIGDADCLLVSFRTPIRKSVLDNCLQILFQFPLHESDITVADKNGNIVINEQQTSIYEGKTLYIYTPEDYPYTIEITSPAVDITGEITLEEED